MVIARMRKMREEAEKLLEYHVFVVGEHDEFSFLRNYGHFAFYEECSVGIALWDIVITIYSCASPNIFW